MRKSILIVALSFISVNAFALTQYELNKLNGKPGVVNATLVDADGNTGGALGAVATNPVASAVMATYTAGTSGWLAVDLDALSGGANPPQGFEVEYGVASSTTGTVMVTVATSSPAAGFFSKELAANAQQMRQAIKKGMKLYAKAVGVNSGIFLIIRW